MTTPGHPSRTLYVSLPVADLERSTAFFAKLGFSHDPRFSGDTAACLPIGEHAVVMLLSKETFAQHAPLPQAIRRGALVAAGALLALVVTGTVSTAAGPHPGSSDVERLWRLHAAVYVHVRATAIFGVLFLSFLFYIVRNRARWPLYAEGAGVLLFLLVLQMSVGELQYRTHLPWWLVLIHVGLAAAVWACAVALVALIERPPEPFAPRA